MSEQSEGPTALVAPSTHDVKLELGAQGEFFLNSEIRPQHIEPLGLSMLRYAYAHRYWVGKPGLTLTINSPGGDVTEGFWLGSIIQRIRTEFGCRVTTRIQGEAHSMAFTISQYGDRRIVDASASLHIHDVQLSNLAGDHATLRDYEIFHDRLRVAIAALLAQRNTAGHNDPQWWLKTYMGQGTNHYLTPQIALDLGLVDEIVGYWVPGVPATPVPIV